MASKLGIAVSTVQGWKQRDAIPLSRLPQIRAAAEALGLDPDPPAPHAPSPETPAPPKSESKAPEAPRAAPPVSAPMESRPPPPQPKAPGAPWRIRAPIVGGAALILLAAGTGYVIWSQRAISAALAERDALLARRMAAVEERAAPDAFLGRRLTALEDTAASLKSRLDAAPAPAAGASPAELASLRARIEALARERAEPADGAAQAALTARLDRIQAQAEAATAAVAALRAELARLEATGPRADAALARALALTGAAGRLRSAVAAERGIAEELTAARQAAAGMPALLAALAPLGEGEAVPGRARLLNGFPARATAALSAMRSQAGETWGARTLARLAGVISVRRVGADVPGDDAEALIARAEAQLKQGALSAAAEALSRLPAPASAEFAPWLAGARLHLVAEAALAALDAEAAGALAGAARPAARPQPER